MPDTTAASSIQTADLQEALYYLSMCIYLADKRPLDRASFLGLLEIASSALLRAGYTQESALVTQTGNLIGQTSPASLVANLKDVWGVLDRGTPTEGVVVWPEYSSDVSTALSKAVIYASQLLTFQGNASDKDLRPGTPSDGLVTMHYRKRTDAMLDAQKVVTCVHGPLQYATTVRLRRSLYIRWGSFEDESLLREHLIQEGILSY